MNDETYRPWNHRSLTGHFDGFSPGGTTHKLIVRGLCYRFLAQACGRGGQIQRSARGRNLESIPIEFLFEGKGRNKICAQGRRKDSRGKQRQVWSHFAELFFLFDALSAAAK